MRGFSTIVNQSYAICICGMRGSFWNITAVDPAERRSFMLLMAELLVLTSMMSAAREAVYRAVKHSVHMPQIACRIFACGERGSASRPDVNLSHDNHRDVMKPSQKCGISCLKYSNSK